MKSILLTFILASNFSSLLNAKVVLGDFSCSDTTVVGLFKRELFSYIKNEYIPSYQYFAIVGDSKNKQNPEKDSLIYDKGDSNNNIDNQTFSLKRLEEEKEKTKLEFTCFVWIQIYQTKNTFESSPSQPLDSGNFFVTFRKSDAALLNLGIFKK